MKKQADNPNPRNSAGFLSVLFFTYTLDTFRKGRFWNVHNLYKPLDSHRSEVLCEKFERLWSNHTEECRNIEKMPSIFVVLSRLFWLDILVDSCLLVLSLAPRIIQPLLLGNILSYFSPSSTITKSEAYWYIALLVVFNLMSTIVTVQYKFSSSITAMKIRVSCSTFIHRKTLKMSIGCQNNALNLISNDLSRLDRTSNYVHYVWGSPLFLISIMNLLYYDVGISGVFGVLWFILYMVLQSYFAHWIGSYRNKIAQKTDIRIELMNEILSSIKVIKMYAWEKPFSRLVEGSRDVEMSIVKKVTYLKGILYSLQSFVNISAVFLALLTMTFLQEEITAPKVFKLIMYYHSFNFAITLMFPLSVTKATELHQVLKRVNEFLLEEEITKCPQIIERNVKDRIVLEDFTATWSSHKKSGPKSNLLVGEESLLRKQETKFVLRNIRMKLEDGMLYGVTGSVGSGKSSLLLAILGETVNSGSSSINGSISYVSQDPWFFPGTIRQNILFDEPFQEQRYADVIRVCGLRSDLDQLAQHDRTPVGECGLCLSGGQKSKINLARAIYRDVDIYLFDDPISSVDVSVANLLMVECIMEFLKNKCRVLVTHNVNHLKKCDRIFILNSGRIEMEGTFHEMERKGNFSLDYLEKQNPTEGDSIAAVKTDHEPKINPSPKNPCKPLANPNEKKSDLFTYLTSGNNLFAISLVFTIFIITQTTESSVFLFISYWTHSEETKESFYNITLGHQVTAISGRHLHLFIFLAILLVLLVSSIVRAVTYAVMVMRSSKTLHQEMLDRVLHSQMTFFEKVDIGQILSRFSKDLGAVDEVLPRTILESCMVVLGIIARILLIGYVNPYLIIVVLAFAAIFSHFIRVFVYTSKNIKRIEANLMGPVLTQMRSTIQGLSTIRAVNAEEVMEKEFSRYQNRYTSSLYVFYTITHAFSFGVELVTTIFISIVTVSCFLMEERIHLNGSQIGLAITQSMAFTTYLQFCIIQCVQANNHLVAVERIQEYKELSQESVAKTGDEVEAEWPKSGDISFEDVQVQYDENEQPVLNELNFTIESGQKVGIVGRTGGGKSSLFASILKLATIEGSITIDSKNIQEIPVDIVRSRISVIPQDPIIFSGSLRHNLDPFERYDDHALYQSLNEVEWASTSSGIHNLDDQIMDSGSNLSIGQKQLICLARTILRHNKIVLIDEATSNMDIETDKMMQKVIRKHFKNCTVLTIAHRVSTVLDSDKIMVIECGRMIEFDSPDVLLGDSRSKLYEMLHEKNK